MSRSPISSALKFMKKGVSGDSNLRLKFRREKTFGTSRYSSNLPGRSPLTERNCPPTSKMTLTLSKSPAGLFGLRAGRVSVFFVSCPPFPSCFCRPRAFGAAESATAMTAKEVTAPLTSGRSRSEISRLMSASSAREGSPRRVVGAVDLAVAVHTAPVEGEDVEPGHGRVARQHVHVALLAKLVAASGQQADVVGAVRRVAGEAVLLHGVVLPEERPALLRVTLVAELVGRGGREHFAPLPAVRVMTGGATHLHLPVLGAEQVGGALEEGLPLVGVAAEAGLLHGEARQHPGGEL